MLEGELYNEVVWTKLFKRNLLENMRFEVGIVCEDTTYMYKIIHKAEKICCIGAPKYNYLRRNNSTMGRYEQNLKIDAVLIYDEMYKFISKHYPDSSDLVVFKLADHAMSVLNLILSRENFKEYEKKYYKVVGILNSYYSKTIKLKAYPKTVKVLLTATKVHPLLYKIIISNLNKRR